MEQINDFYRALLLSLATKSCICYLFENREHYLPNGELVWKLKCIGGNFLEKYNEETQGFSHSEQKMCYKLTQKIKLVKRKFLVTTKIKHGEIQVSCCKSEKDRDVKWQEKILCINHVTSLSKMPTGSETTLP